MKLCVSSRGKDLDSQVDERFGRCGFFLFVDTDSMECEAVPNSAAQGAGGVGVAAAKCVSDRKAAAVLTGNCGPNAYQALSAAGVEVYAGVSGSVKEAVAAFKEGKLQASSQPSTGPHHGGR